MVTSAAPPRRYTIDDLDELPDDGKLRELVDGRIVEWDMPNLLHGLLMGLLYREIERYAREHHLGSVVIGDTMVRILGSQHTARGADVAFYRRGRIPRDVTSAATEAVPDFVIEVVSPSDRAGMVQEKVRDWLGAGVRLLWYVNPEAGLTTVYHNGRMTNIEAADVLDGGDVAPGLQIRLQDLLRELDEQTKEVE